MMVEEISDKSAAGQEPKKERTIDELVDLPYSEMTDEEIGRLVEWKAENKARDKRFEAEKIQLEQMLAEKARACKEAAEQSTDLLNRLCAAALEGYENGKTQAN